MDISIFIFSLLIVLLIVLSYYYFLTWRYEKLTNKKQRAQDIRNYLVNLENNAYFPGYEEYKNKIGGDAVEHRNVRELFMANANLDDHMIMEVI